MGGIPTITLFISRYILLFDQQSLLELLESSGAHTVLMKIGTLANRAISVPGLRKAGLVQDRVAWDEVVVKVLGRDREGHDTIRTGPGQDRIRAGQYLPTGGKGHARQVGQSMWAQTRANRGRLKKFT